MCYSNCPFENFHGECSNCTKNSKSASAHCNDDIECKACGCSFDQEENVGDTNLCPDCFEAWEMTECKNCNAYFEKMEIEDGFCPDCNETKFKR